jgi:hypothetical protein
MLFMTTRLRAAQPQKPAPKFKVAELGRAKVRTSIVGATIFEPAVKPSRKCKRLLHALKVLQVRGL